MRLSVLAFGVALGLAGLPRAAGAVPLIIEPGTPARANIVQVWGGCGWGGRPVPGHWSPWRGWVPPHCVPQWHHLYWRHHHHWGHHHYWWRHRHHHWW